MLGYKMEERGGTLVTVDAAFTSQTCTSCGTVDAQSRESQAVFRCVACGHREHADVNAAQNILRRSTALMRMEDLHEQSYEVRTEERLAPLGNPSASAGVRC